MDELRGSVRRCVQAAYESWVGSPAPAGGPSGSPESVPPILRPIRFISWEELDRFAESTADIDAQVRRELALSAPERRARRRPFRHRRSPSRRVA